MYIKAFPNVQQMKWAVEDRGIDQFHNFYFWFTYITYE